MTTISAPSRPAIPLPSSAPRLDEAVARVREGADRLLRLSLDDRIALARSMQSGYLTIAEESVRAACTAKGIPVGTPLEGEEWTLGPWFVVRHLRLVQQALLALKRTGNTPIGPIDRTDDGRLSVRVFPAGPIDGMLFNGVRVDVHLQKEVTEQRLNERRAGFYKTRPRAGRVVLVLGAGNISAIPSLDVITKIFNEGKACILKMNPVNAYVGPYLERAYADAVRNGYLAVVYGGAEEGQYLAHHAEVDEIHMTGSDRTYDQIVWGPPGAEREARRRENRPLLNKPFTAELGGVAPVLVVPGPYSEKELMYQAEDVASGLTFNASFDCNANKVVILPRNWELRDRFLEALRQALQRAADRVAYYPGARQRFERFGGANRGTSFGGKSEGSLPWTLISGMNPDASEPLFEEESFVPILVETAVGSADPVAFLEEAVNFANDRLWGTLAAGIVVHPGTMKDPTTGAAVERAIGRLRYGSVNLNAWSGLSFAFCTPPWGGHPSSTPADIQSGTGFVHNTPMLEGIEKAVMRHPITMKPRPSYSISHRTAHQLMRRMTALDHQAGWTKVPAVLGAAMRA
ncbi:MAG TPA: aldehyde dehydrogenase family protein [Gemmatimonadales bacterium]|nr:aldehyde dehydrogenase family protein [Gemmatimonadales bacterium]